MKEYFIANETNTTHEGPFSFEEIKLKGIKKDTLIWYDGLDNWLEAENIDDFAELFKKQPPPLPSKSNVMPPPLKGKNINGKEELNKSIEPKEQVRNNDEKIYYSNDLGIRITSTRFIVNTSTYPLQGITSIQTAVIKSNKLLPFLLIVISIILILFGFQEKTQSAILIGAIFILLGIFILILSKDTFAVRIQTSAGQADAVTSKDKEYINEVSRALNEAFIHRG